MSVENINLTAPIHAATKQGKAVAAREVFMDGDKETVQQIGEKTYQLEDAIKDITATGGASTANAVSYSNSTSGMTAVTAQGAIDELASKKANSADVTSQMQTEQTRVNAELEKKFNLANITQESGDAEDKVMSQKAVSDKLSDLFDKNEEIEGVEYNNNGFSVSDPELNSILDIDEDGVMRTKGFDSSKVVSKEEAKALEEFSIENDTSNTLNIEDNDGEKIMRLKSALDIDEDGIMRTKGFDSSKVVSKEEAKALEEFSIENDTSNTLNIEDNDGEKIMRLKSALDIDEDGIVRTKGFDSSKRKDEFDIIVDANGNGDYTTIEEALNNAKDSETKHVKILVKCGTYFPSPDVAGVFPYEKNFRNLSIVGENRNKCILRSDIGFYDYTIKTDCTPLRLNGNVNIENLTIFSYSSKFNDYANKVEGFTPRDDNRKASYCIHRDGKSRDGDVFVIKNCTLINDHMTAIGFGLKENVTLRIEDCYIQSEQAEEHSLADKYGTIYGHFDSGKFGLNQNLEVIRCQIVNKTSYQAIAIKDAKGEGATPQNTFANLLFIGNVCDTTNIEKALDIQDTIVGFYAKSNLCYNNNVSQMNKS
ncbi:hypothetical protein KSW77_03865 [Prevotella copri]|uniref:pectinesterase family protein n=1 Tax=Segatella copri TaxID=165179 RepID=UPI001C390248|nr:pectinesterase family protein [Segatella copri]MBV3394660.1 hypothetical protein [Segatella copri]